MGFARIKGNLTSRIGRPVTFGAPKDVERKGGKPVRGVIVDEAWANCTTSARPETRAGCPRAGANGSSQTTSSASKVCQLGGSATSVSMWRCKSCSPLVMRLTLGCGGS